MSEGDKGLSVKTGLQQQIFMAYNEVQPTMVHGPNAVLWSIKFGWIPVTPTCLCIVYACFRATGQSRDIATGTVWLSKPEHTDDPRREKNQGLLLVHVLCPSAYQSFRDPGQRGTDNLECMQGQRGFWSISFGRLRPGPEVPCVISAQNLLASFNRRDTALPQAGAGAGSIWGAALMTTEAAGNRNQDKLMRSSRSFALLNNAAWEGMEENSAGI